MDRKTILITGGNGFIGSFLRRHYKEKHVVFAPERSRLDFTNSDCVNQFFKTHDVDVVIHTALAGRNNLNGIDPRQSEMNLSMFNNLWRNRHKFSQFINLGTGNEFDVSTDINNASEDRLFEHLPISSYGYAKNMIARICRTTQDFTNLRLFGVFHYTELPIRFFHRLYKNPAPFHIFQDHYFDFFNLEDLPVVINAVLDRQNNDKDINVVYPEKFLLSELASMFINVHDIDPSKLIVDEHVNVNFTGDSTRLQNLNLPLKGLTQGFTKYQLITN